MSIIYRLEAVNFIVYKYWNFYPIHDNKNIKKLQLIF